MKIIGIDPSTVSLGFALIEKADTNNPKYFVSTIKAPNKATPDEKFVHIIKETIMGYVNMNPHLSHVNIRLTYKVMQKYL